MSRCKLWVLSFNCNFTSITSYHRVEKLCTYAGNCCFCVGGRWHFLGTAQSGFAELVMRGRLEVPKLLRQENVSWSQTVKSNWENWTWFCILRGTINDFSSNKARWSEVDFRSRVEYRAISEMGWRKIEQGQDWRPCSLGRRYEGCIGWWEGEGEDRVRRLDQIDNTWLLFGCRKLRDREGLKRFQVFQFQSLKA